MKNKKLILLLTLVVIFIPFSLKAIETLSVKTFLSDDDIKKVNSGELISRMYLKYNFSKENTDEKIIIPRTKYNDEDFSVYEAISDEKGFIPFKLTNESKLKFYNTLTSYSKLDGMVYYSRRAGKIIPLIEKCYKVESLSGKKHSDEVYTEIKPEIKNMFFQKDNKFGKLTFRSELYNENDNFILVNTSLESISKLIFTINDPEEYKIYTFFIYDKQKEGFYFYSFQVMRIKIDIVLKSDFISPTTLSNRLRASSVHLTKVLGLNWDEKLNPWVGKYDKY